MTKTLNTQTTTETTEADAFFAFEGHVIRIIHKRKEEAIKEATEGCLVITRSKGWPLCSVGHHDSRNKAVAFYARSPEFKYDQIAVFEDGRRLPSEELEAFEKDLLAKANSKRKQN